MEAASYCHLRAFLCLVHSLCLILVVDSSSLVMESLLSWSENLDSVIRDNNIDPFLLLIAVVFGMIALCDCENRMNS